MSSMIQIGNVPVEAHRALKWRAGHWRERALSELILEELQGVLALPRNRVPRTVEQAGTIRMKKSSDRLICVSVTRVGAGPGCRRLVLYVDLHRGAIFDRNRSKRVVGPDSILAAA